MLPPSLLDFFSFHITYLTSSRTWFRGYWALWKGWSSQIRKKKSHTKVDHPCHAVSPTLWFFQPSYHLPSFIWDLILRLLSILKRTVEPDLHKKIRFQSWPPRSCCLPHTSIFTAFTWPAWLHLGLDFGVIEPSEEDGRARFARKNQVVEMPKVPLPPILLYSDIMWRPVHQRMFLVFFNIRNRLGMVPERFWAVWIDMCHFTSYPSQRSIFTAFPWLARTPGAFFPKALEPSEHDGQARFARKNRVLEIYKVPLLPPAWHMRLCLDLTQIRYCRDLS
jgi:hypothetical protein